MFEAVDPDKFADIVIELNKLAGELGTVDINKLKSSVASSDYYRGFEMKLASIVRSMIKNHAFLDGNKRSASMFFRLMLAYSKRKSSLSTEAFIEMISDIAEHDYTVEQIAKKLFDSIKEDDMRIWINIINENHHSIESKGTNK